MESKELLTKASDLASRDVDLYALVGLDENDEATSGLDPKAIHRSWRKASIKHHPDKAGTNFDPEKWDLLETARDVLLDTAARSAYDSSRKAQRMRRAERAKVEGHRKRLIDELEAAENEAKRQRKEEKERAMEMERERARLAEEGRRRMAEEAERFKREQLEQREQKARLEDEEDDDRLKELQARLDEVRRRKAEKKARKKGKGGKEEDGDAANGEGEDAATAVKVESNGAKEAPPRPVVPPRWEDLKAKMIAVQKRRDAEKLAREQAQTQTQAEG